MKSAFTVSYPSIVRELRHEVLISKACRDPVNAPPLDALKYQAIWDTGAKRQSHLKLLTILA